VVVKGLKLHEADADGVLSGQVGEGLYFIVVDSPQHHHIDFQRNAAEREKPVEVCFDALEFIAPGNCEEPVGAKAVNTQVDCVNAGRKKRIQTAVEQEAVCCEADGF